MIGLYVSDHPLSPYQTYLRRKISHFSGQLHEVHNRGKVTVAGLVTSRNHQTKNGNAMGFITLEDIQGNVELVVFPRTWERTREQLLVGQILIVEGKVDTSNTPPKVLVDTVRTEFKMTVSADEALIEAALPASTELCISTLPGGNQRDSRASRSERPGS